MTNNIAQIRSREKYFSSITKVCSSKFKRVIIIEKNNNTRRQVDDLSIGIHHASYKTRSRPYCIILFAIYVNCIFIRSLKYRKKYLNFKYFSPAVS